ncbi:MAG: DNA ligase-associated DEXH box helicase, partial [Pseudomonadota bacterium]|nr:DNA ligase-associated DEXH box helicase [Pseudomonadota bacterium]
LSRNEFEDILNFVTDGGYALAAYDRYKRLVKGIDGKLRVASKLHIRRYRMNIGTIVEAPKLKVRIKRGRVLGEVEEYFVNGLLPGDTFIFAGETLQFEGIRDMNVEVIRAPLREPKVPAYVGGRLPLTTSLAARVRGILESQVNWTKFPAQVRKWLSIQSEQSILPRRDELLVETFPRGGKYFTVAYLFEGRNAHQTLGMLLTKRMERAGLRPLGFVATDYVISVWSLNEPKDIPALFGLDMMADDLEEWMLESSMMKRMFRNVAVIAGLIERRHPGAEKSRRQVTFNSDLIYDVLRKYEPSHILLRATRADAEGELIDLHRLFDHIQRVQGKITHRPLRKVSPLAVPVILEIGRERVDGLASDDLLAEAENEIISEAMNAAID